MDAVQSAVGDFVRRLLCVHLLYYLYIKIVKFTRFIYAVLSDNPSQLVVALYL